MGVSPEKPRMKFLIVCLIAGVSAAPAPEAEADPAYYYGGYGYPYAFNQYPAYYLPHVAQKVVKAVEGETAEAEEVKEETAVKTVTAPFFAHHGLYPFGAYRTYAPYTYAPYTTYGHNYVSYTNGHPVTYAFAPKAPVEDKKMAKREAEPEADAYYGYYGYGRRYGYSGYYRPYTYGYHGYPYSSFYYGR